MREFLTALLLSAAALLSGRSEGAEIRLLGLVDGMQIIELSGPIELGDDKKFTEVTGGIERASVHLNSPGGSVTAGMGIGSQIAQNGFDTFVAEGGECYSICAIIWVSGASRVMHASALIGVHAAYKEVAQPDGSSKPLETGAANADIGFYLGRLGLSREAVRYFTTAGPTETLPVTPYTARLLDLEPFVWDGHFLQTPEQFPSPRRFSQQAVSYMGLSSDCSELINVDPVYLFTKGKERLNQGNSTYGVQSITSFISESSQQLHNDRAARGLIAWCVSTEISLRDQGLDTGVTGPSFSCSDAGTSTESTICQSTDLWTMDRIMSNLYSLIRRQDPHLDRQAFLQEQRAWLGRRNSCNGAESCIKSLYLARLLDFGI